MNEQITGRAMRVRTLVEIQGGRVSIREAAGDTTVTISVDGALSEDKGYKLADQAMDRLERAERQRDELTSAMDVREIEHLRETDSLRVKIRELAAERDRFKAWAERAEANGFRLAFDLVAAEKSVTEIREMLAQRDAALDLAADDLARSQEVARELRQSLEARDRLLAEATVTGNKLADQIGKVNVAVHSPYILSALQTPWQSWTEQQAVALTRAVQDTRRAIGSPSLGTDKA